MPRRRVSCRSRAVAYYDFLTLSGSSVAVLAVDPGGQTLEWAASGPAWQERGPLCLTTRGTPVDPRKLSCSRHRSHFAHGLPAPEPHATQLMAAMPMLAEGVPVKGAARYSGKTSLAPPSPPMGTCSRRRSTGQRMRWSGRWSAGRPARAGLEQTARGVGGRVREVLDPVPIAVHELDRRTEEVLRFVGRLHHLLDRLESPLRLFQFFLYPT